MKIVIFLSIVISKISETIAEKESLRIWEDEEYYKYIDIYEYDANRFRRSLVATDMQVVRWNQTLQHQSQEAGESMIKHFRCNQPWDCTTAHCDSIVRMQLSRNEKLKHIILRSYDTPDHAMGRMFEFLGVESPTPCGKHYETFDNKNIQCKQDAIKIYKKTQQVGCTLLKCQKKERGDSKPISYRHFVCIFDPLISSLPVDSTEKLQLYTPAKHDYDICSQCPSKFPKCQNGLCTGTSSKFSHVYRQVLLLYLFLHKFCIIWR